MTATDVHLTELFAVKFGAAAASALAQSWLRGQVREHDRQRRAGGRS